MPRDSWTVRIELSETCEAVYAHATLVDAPVYLSGHGHAPLTDGTGSPAQSRAVAARRAVTDLIQGMRTSLETCRPAPVTRPWASARGTPRRQEGT